MTFTTSQHTVLSPRTFPVPVLVQSSFYLFNSFPGRQLLSHDGTENPANLVALSWGWRIVNPAHKWTTILFHQILEHGHLAPNEPQWWIPSWKLSFAKQICNRFKNRHRLLYLQPTVMVSGLHIQVFYTRSWTPRFPVEPLGVNCYLNHALLDYHYWIWVTDTFKIETQVIRVEAWSTDRHDSGGSLEPRLESSWWKRFCYLWLQAQTQTTVRQYHFQTIKPLGSTDCLQNPMQRDPEKLGIKCKKHKGREQRTHREVKQEAEICYKENGTLQHHNVPKALRLTASKFVYKSKTDIQILTVQIRLFS